MTQNLKHQPSQDFGPDSGGRIKGLAIVKPIVYGNLARYFGKKREEDGHTHEWTVYVKPYNNEDMSTYVKKMHFKLHESYSNQNRVLTKPPYEVTETGWGEFEIIIKIYFHDPNERPVTLYHILKLFQSGLSVPAPLPPQAEFKKPLVSEFYEELLFQDPSALMEQLLTNSRPLTIGQYTHNTDFEAKKENSLKRIVEGQSKVTQEIADLRVKIKQAKDTIGVFKDEITATTNFRCAFLATTKTWANLYCFLKLENECVITELLRSPSEDSTGLQDPVMCKTRFAEKGARLCTNHPDMGYKGYGCLQFVQITHWWIYASSTCQDRGMDLVSFERFTSKTQLQTVADHLGLVSGARYYVGFSQNLADSKFYWTSTGTELKTGDPLWATSEPSHGILEDVGMLVNDGLHDVGALGLYYFICSFP